jgi:hypothetical protein
MRRVLFLPLFAAFTATPVLLNGTAQASESPAPTLVNRSVLSVEGIVYSLYDVKILLKMWNTAFPDEAVPQSTEWETTSGYFVDKRKSFLTNYERWPADAQKLLAITMTWPEVSHLNLFPTNRENLQRLAAAVRDPLLWSDDELLSRHLKTAPDRRLLELAEMVYRTHASEKSRGSLRESAGSLTWFWHQAPKRAAPPPSAKEPK